jgi:ABC-2 type transport system permease protein
MIYFLWRAIYKGSGGSINGMTFNQTFIYLALAISIFCLFKTWTDWNMSYEVINGIIVMNLIKPMDIQLLAMSKAIGFVFYNFITVTLPALFVIIFIFQPGEITVRSIILSLIPIVLAFFISFNIDYIIGLTSFYTESIWGISIAKDTIVLLLSGALIPINFFPEILRKIVGLLPFQAIYHIPLTILISKDLSIYEYLKFLGIQLSWAIALYALNRFYYSRAIKVVTVNGG